MSIILRSTSVCAFNDGIQTRIQFMQDTIRSL